MNRITKIKKLKGCATFRNTEWPDDLPAFSRYNLIYGWNGSGKTTLSRIFRHLELKKPPECEDVTIEFSDTSKVTNADFSANQATAIRVFNRDFIATNVFPVDGNIPPVFVLGERSKEDQSQLDAAQAQLPKTRAELEGARKLRSKADKDVEDHEKDNAKAIKDVLQPSSIDPYRNYNQAHYRTAARSALQSPSVEKVALSEARKNEIRLLITQQPLPKVSPLEPWSEHPGDFVDRVNELLLESVVATVIPVLQQNSQLSKWVEQGLVLHPRGERAECKFCGESIPPHRIADLEAHFNNAVAALKQRITNLVNLLIQAEKRVARTAPNKAELYQNLQDSYALEIKGVRDLEVELRNQYKVLLDALAKKADNPFASTPPLSPTKTGDQSHLLTANIAIGVHNRQTDNLKMTKQAACKEWEEDAIVASLPAYSFKLDEQKRTATAVTAFQEEVSSLSARIEELGRELRQHRTPAEDFNRDLHDYLGHSEIGLRVHETGYQIMRGPRAAKHLSEGERTAIAILYFLRTFDDTSFDLTDGIVVLDDPISSLDENSMFSAYGYIQRRTRGAGQLFVLTHNFSFFRLIKSWLFKQSKPDRSMYMLTCSEIDGKRNTMIARLDPLLEKFESEYHYLFSLVRQTSGAAPGVPLSTHYHMPNIARRLLETFLMFKVPSRKQTLYEMIEGVEFDGPKKARILRFCQTHSHLLMVSDSEHDPTILVETPSVMKDIMDLIEAADKGHFDGLSRLCGDLLGGNE
jgi:wobble nucleotide-excising tRNase